MPASTQRKDVKGRDPRFFTPHTLVETTTVTFQNRYLTRPSEELNDVFLGVLGLAQAMYEMPICGVSRTL